MSDDTRPLSSVPTLLAGRYRLRGSIGQGGMADVQRAYDEQLDREVAVKILHARYADDPNFLLRFRREAQSAASLNHPNIVSVYDAGDASGRPFIVMELVRGRSLREVTRSERITADRSTEIVGDAALALNYAHEHGLIHRDIKPGNILISNDGEVKVTDFGIARAVNAETITETAAVFGTAAYVSPEQAQGDAVDRRTDVYSLGCVLYELLAGQQPFHADSPVALAYQHVSAMPMPPSHLSDESTPELDAITLKAMAKDPDDRYQTAREFNADLERARAGVPVTAPMAGAIAATQAVGGRNDETVVSSSGSYTEPVDEQPYYDDYYEDEPPRSRAGWVIAAVLVLLALLAGGWWLFTSFLAGGETVQDVPDVVGEQVEQAMERLDALGFENVRTESTQQSGFEENAVVDQNPAAGEQVPIDTEIVLTVNTGAPPVEVPNVVEDTRREARQELNDAGLRVGDVSEEASDTVEEGLVIRTDPAPGTEVPEDTEVNLVISTGSNQAQVPDVVDRRREDAEQALNDACDPQPCFGAFVTEEFSDVEAGRVIRQSPEGGQQAPKGSDVTLVVSRGPEEEPEPEPEPTPTTTVPDDLVGMQVDDAVIALRDASLAPGETENRASDEFPEPGTVIESNPEPGEEVDAGTRVALVISTGPETSGDGTGNGNGNGGGNGTGNGNGNGGG